MRLLFGRIFGEDEFAQGLSADSFINQTQALGMGFEAGRPKGRGTTLVRDRATGGTGEPEGGGNIRHTLLLSR